MHIHNSMDTSFQISVECPSSDYELVFGKLVLFWRKNGNVEVDEWRRRLAVNWNVAETFLLGGKLNLLWSCVLCTLLDNSSFKVNIRSIIPWKKRKSLRLNLERYPAKQ